MTVLAYATLTACSVGAVVPDVEVVQQAGFADDLFVARSAHLYIAGQPDAADLGRFKNLGVTTVVNLRHPDEMDWDEAKTARALGLTYYQVPVIANDKLKSSALDLVDELVQANGPQSVLVHCRSGNRAAAWWARHLVREHDVQPKPALTAARRAGLTHPPLQKEVKALLK